MIRSLKILLWRALALVALLLAVIGTFLPVMPTVPFVLLAAWAGGKGWPRLETWLLNHAAFGSHIRDWRAHGAVSRRAKWFATCALLGSAILLQVLPLPAWADTHAGATWLRHGLPMLFALILLWLWRRPEPRPPSGH